MAVDTSIITIIFILIIIIFIALFLLIQAFRIQELYFRYTCK